MIQSNCKEWLANDGAVERRCLATALADLEGETELIKATPVAVSQDIVVMLASGRAGSERSHSAQLHGRGVLMVACANPESSVMFDEPFYGTPQEAGLPYRRFLDSARDAVLVIDHAHLLAEELQERMKVLFVLDRGSRRVTLRSLMCTVEGAVAWPSEDGRALVAKSDPGKLEFLYDQDINTERTEVFQLTLDPDDKIGADPWRELCYSDRDNSFEESTIMLRKSIVECAMIKYKSNGEKVADHLGFVG